MKIIDTDFSYHLGLECTQEEFNKIPKQWINYSCCNCVCSNDREINFLIEQFGLNKSEINTSDYIKFIII